MFHVFRKRRVKKKKRNSKIRSLKIGFLRRKIGFYEAHPGQIARSCIHFFPCSRSADQIFLGIIARDVRRFASLPLASSSGYLRVAHARDHSAHVFHRGEDGFLRFSRGCGSRWRTASACGLARSLVISREIVFALRNSFEVRHASAKIFSLIFTRLSLEKNRSLSLASFVSNRRSIVAFLFRKRRNNLLTLDSFIQSDATGGIRFSQTNDPHSFRLIY